MEQGEEKEDKGRSRLLVGLVSIYSICVSVLARHGVGIGYKGVRRSKKKTKGGKF